MHVAHLSLHDFRSWAQVDLELGPGATALIGRNGQGKTNIVEGLDYLARLGSHRVASDAPLVRRGAERAIARAAVVNDERRAVLEVEISPGRSNRARVNSSPLPRPRDLLGYLRSVVFAPDDLALVKGDPGERRRYLDDLLVQLSPRYAGTRSDYDRVLKQRNSLLKSARHARGSSQAALATLEVWDERLADLGAEIRAGRLRLVEQLVPVLGKAYASVARGAQRDDATARYRVGSRETGADEPPTAERRSGGFETPTSSAPQPPGSAASSAEESRQARPASEAEESPEGPASSAEYRPDASAPVVEERPEGASRNHLVDHLRDQLLAEISARRQDELDRGLTLVGPQRDDLLCALGDLPVKGYSSHGESWSFALALRLASYQLLRSPDLGASTDPVLILDDVFAELDETRRGQLAELVADAEQVLVTAAVPDDVPEQLRGTRYLVADGRLTRE